MSRSRAIAVSLLGFAGALPERPFVPASPDLLKVLRGLGPLAADSRGWGGRARAGRRHKVAPGVDLDAYTTSPDIGVGPFGVLTDPRDGTLAADPIQWPVVRMIFDACVQELMSARQIAALSTACGFPMTDGLVYDMLRSRLYVDGRLPVDDHRSTALDVDLHDPIDPVVFDAAQVAVRMRTGGRADRPHPWSLNRIDMTHHLCAATETALRGKVVRGSEYYRHWPAVPEPCQGVSFDRAKLEASALSVVLERLLDATTVRGEFKRACDQVGVAPDYEPTLRRALADVDRDDWVAHAWRSSVVTLSVESAQVKDNVGFDVDVQFVDGL